MADFRLPNTPPQGYTFPPNSNDKIDAVVTSNEMEPSEPSQQTQHRRNPSHPILTIDTSRVGTAVRTQPVAPPPPAVIPPPPARPNASAPRRTSHDLPLRNTQQSNRSSVASDIVPAHRSIFPQYDPSAQAGSRNITPPRQVMAVTPPLPPSASMNQSSQNNYTASIYSNNSRPCHVQNNSLSEAFAISNDPSHAPLPSYRESMLEMPAAIQSNPHDIMDLWCLACGQETQELAICYNLGLDCTDLTTNSELICLTSTGGALYSLRAMSNDLNVIRTHPMTSTSMVSVATPHLYQPSEASPLLTTVFPVLSKIRAIDRAASVAIANGLPRNEASSLEREAITRAHATTAAPLLWNAQTGGFYLTLPVFPESESGPAAGHRILPVEITPNVSIRILEPPSSSAVETRSPILTFSLPTKTLIVHANAVVTLPSPYAVDILLSSMLVLLLHLHRTTAILADDSTAPAAVAPQPVGTAPMQVPTFAPPPLVARSDVRGRSRSAARSASRNRGSSGSRSRGPSRLENFLHPSRARSAMGSYSEQEQPAPSSRSANRLSTYSMHSTAPTLRASPPLPSSNTLAIQPSNETMASNGMIMGFAPPPTTPGLEKGIVVHSGGGGGGRQRVEENQDLSAQGTAPELDVRNTGLDLSRFQTYDLADPRLGTGTRLMLRVLYWGFGCTVWIIGVIIGILAEGIVTVGTCGAGAKDGE